VGNEKRSVDLINCQEGRGDIPIFQVGKGEEMSSTESSCHSVNFVWLNRQTTEVTVSTSFRAEALACSTQRGLSHVT
jgi:hypothetical protein